MPLKFTSEAEHALKYLLDQAWNWASKLTPSSAQALLPGIWCIYQIDADTTDFFLSSHSLISLGYVLVRCVAD